jgi:hypothetical protein
LAPIAITKHEEVMTADTPIIGQPTVRTLDVPTAGREYFGLGRNASYEAARRGDLPTIRLGRLLRVPVIALDRMLEAATPSKPQGSNADVLMIGSDANAARK